MNGNRGLGAEPQIKQAFSGFPSGKHEESSDLRSGFFTKALNEIAGVQNAKIDLAKGEATFDETESVDTNTVKEKIKRAGYEVV
jgi:hypothetical protein